jgi:hypothetical protein
MNTNSFQIKGFAITIVSAFLAIYATNQKQLILLLGVFPTIVFWFLDAYYLAQERRFRGLYNDICEISDNQRKIQHFNMRIDSYKGGSFSYCNALVSKSIMWMYGMAIVCLILFYCLENNQCNG